MSTSKLTLYVQSGMKIENNYIIEDIFNYLKLNNQGYKTIDNYQYIRDPAKDQVFKIDVPQADYDNAVIDYAMLEQDGRLYYYFITAADWKSQNCLGFTAVLDTLNTYQDQYDLTDRSIIERQHVDRFRLTGPRPTGDSINEIVTNVISPTKEELQPELLMTRHEVLSGDFPVDTKYQWYLIYQTNTESGNPEILMCADKDIRLSGEPTTQEYILTPTKMKQSSYMIFDRCTIKYYVNLSTTETITIDMNGMIAFYKTTDSDRFTFTYYSKDGSNATIEQLTNKVIITANNTCKLYAVNTVIFDKDAIAGSPYTLIGAPDTLTGIESIDRTRSNLYKVIECPYCPLDLNITEGSMPTLPDKWSFDSERGKFVCSDLTFQFPERKVWTEENVINMIAGQAIIANRDKLTLYSRHDHRNGEEGNIDDPKSYISTLKAYNFVYDTVSWSIIPEDLEIPNKKPRPDLIFVSYKQSNNISSDCGFKFDIPEFTMKHRQYFDQYMFSARSNELPLYSSDYINYMRNGYNYDKKANALQTAASIVGVVGSAVGTGLSSIGQISAFSNRPEIEALRAAKNIGFTDITQPVDAPIKINYPYRDKLRALQTPLATGIIGAGVNAVTSAISATLSHYQRENALEQKINEYKDRAFSVSTTGNHDLFKWYSGNKVLLFEFEPREEVRDLINDYFSLYGYAQGYYEKPDLDSRLFFNYCRGTVDIDNFKKNRSLEEHKADIIKKFQDGVYKIHKVNTPLGTYWDVKLERQNYERSIIPLEWCE